MNITFTFPHLQHCEQLHHNLNWGNATHLQLSSNIYCERNVPGIVAESTCQRFFNHERKSMIKMEGFMSYPMPEGSSRPGACHTHFHRTLPRLPKMRSDTKRNLNSIASTRCHWKRFPLPLLTHHWQKVDGCFKIRSSKMWPKENWISIFAFTHHWQRKDGCFSWFDWSNSQNILLTIDKEWMVAAVIRTDRVREAMSESLHWFDWGQKKIDLIG